MNIKCFSPKQTRPELNNYLLCQANGQPVERECIAASVQLSMVTNQLKAIMQGFILSSPAHKVPSLAQQHIHDRPAHNQSSFC